MNEAMQLLLERRSVRKYKNEMVPREIIEKIVEAGTYAPSGMGRQATKVIAVTNKEIRDRLSEANRSFGSWPEGFDPFYGAPVVLIVLDDADCPTKVYDGSCVMENLMLAAHANGVASCWIHRAKEVFSLPEWKEWLRSLGVEGNYEGIGNCILGYADGDAPAAAERKSDRAIIVD